jgi:hypothetical protein
VNLCVSFRARGASGSGGDVTLIYYSHGAGVSWSTAIKAGAPPHMYSLSNVLMNSDGRLQQMA